MTERMMVILICAILAMAFSGCQRSHYTVAQETLQTATQKSVDYADLVEKGRHGDSAAIETLIDLDIFDAAAALGHGVVVYDIRHHLGAQRFEQCLKNLDEQQSRRLGRWLEVGAAYSVNSPTSAANTMKPGRNSGQQSPGVRE